MFVSIIVVAAFVLQRKKVPNREVPQNSRIAKIQSGKVFSNPLPQSSIAVKSSENTKIHSRVQTPNAALSNSSSLPTDDDVFALINFRADYFEAYVIPKMNLLPSPCKTICAESTYDQFLISRDPEYEKNFFEVNPEAAFADPEFRIAAEVLKNSSITDSKVYRDKFRRVEEEMQNFPEDFEKVTVVLNLNREHLAEKKKYAPRLKEISTSYGKFREIRSKCNTENPSELEKLCYKLLAPTGHFPQL